MSRFVAPIFAVLLLISCVPATAMPTATPAVTVTYTLTSSPVPTATETITPTPKPLEPNVLQPETLGCYKNDMCLGLEAVDGHARYMELLEAFAVEYENRQYMAGMRTADQFLEFLRNSKHADPVTGEMRPYWVPFKKNGAEFRLLQGNKYNPVFIPNSAMQSAGGFFLDDVAFIAASKKEVDTNKGGVSDWLNNMWEQNGEGVLVRTSITPVEMWGLTLVDGQLVFVGLNNAIPQNPTFQTDRLLGQPDPNKNGQILSAYWELYVRVHGLYGNSATKNLNRGFITNFRLEPDSNKWYSPGLCIATSSGGYCDGKGPAYFSGDGALFIPTQQ